MTAMRPTAAARRPPWTFRLPAPLPLELGADVVSLGSADEVDEVDSWELVVDAELSVPLDDEFVAVLLELSVEVIVEVSVVLVPDEVPLDVAGLLEVAEPVEAVPTAVPVAPLMPKLGEKLMLVGSVSSMISMV